MTSTKDFQVADLRRMSHFYFVSVEAMALRLEQLNLIPKGSWAYLKQEKFSPRKSSELLDLQPLPTNNEPYPERYKYLAVHAYARAEIGDSELAHYLRCDIATAREIVGQTLTSRELESTGEERQLRLDFDGSLLSMAL